MKGITMKKISIILIILMLSSGSWARVNNGPYIAVRGGIASVSTELPRISNSKDSDTDFLYGFAIGARARQTRIEAEFTSSSKIKYGIASYLKQRYMLQLYYDVPLNSVIRPYLNIGAGAAYTDLSVHENNIKSKDHGTSFAWNAGAGLSVSVNQAINFDIGYRYVDDGKKEFFKQHKVHITSHEGYMGVRYTF